jgi:hypothetical protein
MMDTGNGWVITAAIMLGLIAHAGMYAPQPASGPTDVPCRVHVPKLGPAGPAALPQ